MYPNGELKRLAARKARLRERIQRRRFDCVSLCDQLAAPLATIDTWRERMRHWRSYLPWGVALFGLWRSRRAPRAEPARESFGGKLSRWMPVVLQGVQMFRKG